MIDLQVFLARLGPNATSNHAQSLRRANFNYKATLNFDCHKQMSEHNFFQKMVSELKYTHLQVRGLQV